MLLEAAPTSWSPGQYATSLQEQSVTGMMLTRGLVLVAITGGHEDQYHECPCGGDDRSASHECFIGPPAKRFAAFPCLRPSEENPKGYRQDCRVARRCCLRYWDSTEGLSLARYSPALRYAV